MKKKVLFEGKICMVAVLLCFSAATLFAQGGSGRITPTTRGTTTTTTTTSTTKPKKPTTASTTTRRPQTTTRTVPRTPRRTTTRTFDYYYGLGLKAFDEEDYTTAINNFTQAIRLNARSADAFYNRGLAYYYMEEYEQSIEDYTRSIQLKPSADAYNNRGLAFEMMGDYELAEKDYRAALRIQPGYELAQSNLERLQSEDYSNEETGRAGDNKNRNNNQGDNRDTAYYVDLADSYFDNNDFVNALTYYNRAIQINPQDASPYVRRGFSLHYLGDVAKAYQDYETAIRLRPALGNEAYMKCMSYDVTKDDARRGVAVCTETLNEFPRFSLAYYKRGVAYRELKDYQRGLQDFTKSIELVPNFFNSYIYRGLIYAANNKFSMAIPEYTRAIQIIGINDPKSYLAYNNRGYAHEMSGNLTQAAADFRKSFELNPDFTTARDNLNRVLQKQRGNY